MCSASLEMGRRLLPGQKEWDFDGETWYAHVLCPSDPSRAVQYTCNFLCFFNYLLAELGLGRPALSMCPTVSYQLPAFTGWVSLVFMYCSILLLLYPFWVGQIHMHTQEHRAISAWDNSNCGYHNLLVLHFLWIGQPHVYSPLHFSSSTPSPGRATYMYMLLCLNISTLSLDRAVLCAVTAVISQFSTLSKRGSTTCVCINGPLSSVSLDRTAFHKGTAHEILRQQN